MTKTTGRRAPRTAKHRTATTLVEIDKGIGLLGSARYVAEVAPQHTAGDRLFRALLGGTLDWNVAGDRTWAAVFSLRDALNHANYPTLFRAP